MSSRTLKIICAVSVLLNIFLLGAAVGGVVWVRARHPLMGVGAIRVVGSELPADERRAFRRALREARLEMRPTAMAGRQARDDAATLLRAPTLDQAALDEALARARAADIAIRGHVEQRAVAFAATLPPDERAKLAEGIERRHARAHTQTTEPRR
ncbi:periplasmic heavy metal sensor [Sphingomonas oryzagri]